MKQGYFKNAAKLLGIRTAYIFITVFFLYTFAWLIGFKHGVLYYSLLVCLFYLWWVFSDYMEQGKKDMRAKRVKLYAKGFLCGLLSECVDAVLLAATFFGLPSYIFLLWNAPFIGFICPDGDFLDAGAGIMLFVVLAIVPLFCGVG